MKTKVRAFIAVAFLIIVAAVLLKYWLGGASGEETTGSAAGIERAHPPTSMAGPSKANASLALKKKIDHLRQVVERDSANSVAAFEVARLLQDSHNAKDAARYYALGLRSAPSNISARIDYSLCLYELERPTEAMQQCTVVLKYDSINPEALFNLGAIYGNRGARDSAEMYWMKLMSKHPRHELAERARKNLSMLEVKAPSL